MKVVCVRKAKVLPPIGGRVLVPVCKRCRSTITIRRMLPFVLFGLLFVGLAMGLRGASPGNGSGDVLMPGKYWGIVAMVALAAWVVVVLSGKCRVLVDVAFDGANVHYSFLTRVVAQRFAIANGTDIEAAPAKEGPWEPGAPGGGCATEGCSGGGCGGGD